MASTKHEIGKKLHALFNNATYEKISALTGYHVSDSVLKNLFEGGYHSSKRLREGTKPKLARLLAILPDDRQQEFVDLIEALKVTIDLENRELEK